MSAQILDFFKRKWQVRVTKSRKFLTLFSGFFVFFLFPSLCYATRLRKLFTSLLKDKGIKHSPFYRHPTMTYKISCLQSEKSENAVQRGHRCPRIYLSGRFLKAHLKKYTFVNFTPTQTIWTILEIVKLAGKTWACITKFGFDVCESCTKSMSKFFSKCAVLWHWHSTI